MNPKSERVIVITATLLVLIISSLVIGLHLNSVNSPVSPQETPQSTTKQKTASDYANSALAIRIDDAHLVKGDLDYYQQTTEPQPYIRVDYQILVDGQPFDRNSIPDFDVLINRLNWNDLSVTINGNVAQLDRNSYPYLFYPVNLQSEIDVKAKYGSSELSRSFTLTQIQYDMNTINAGTRSLPNTEIEHPRDTIQLATENYALVISGLIFLETHLDELRAKCNSQENWYSWLYYTLNNASSVTDAVNNFESYATVSGTTGLINKIWTELHAFYAARSQFVQIFEEHTQAVATGIIRLTQAYGNPPLSNTGELLYALDSMGSMSSGEEIYSTIQAITKGMEWVYSQLAVEFFGWVANSTSSVGIASYANGSALYMDHLQQVRTWPGTYDLGAGFTFSETHNPFTTIIDVEDQFSSVGERGVAWWPAADWAMYIPPYPANLGDTPFSESSFPITSVKINSQTYAVALATESMVLDYIEKNGFAVKIMPPAADKATEFRQVLAVSQYVLFKAGMGTSVFIGDKTLLDGIYAVSNAFKSYTSLCGAMNTIEKYPDPNALLEEVNHNLWQMS